MGFLPNLGGRAVGFEMSGDIGSHVSDLVRASPGGESGGEEKWVMEPSIFKTETMRSRNTGGGSDKKGEVIGGELGREARAD
jgi:hypothetical protein